MKRTEQNRGAAMVIVLCVMVVFLALSTTIVLAGSVALNTARNNAGYELGKAQAVSLSEVFVRDLEKSGMNAGSVKWYVREEIIKNGWKSYDETKSRQDNEDAVRYFTMDTGEEGTESAKTHQIKIEMYWTYENKDSGMVPGTSLTGDDEANLGDQEVHLFVDVISTLNDAEYHVKRDFRLTGVTAVTPVGSTEYPYDWTWKTVGRNEERG